MTKQVVAVQLVLACLLALVGCSGGTITPPTSATNAPPTKMEKPVPQELLGVADEQNKVSSSAEGEVVTQAGARPSAVVNQGQIQVIAIRDEAERKVDAGTYTLSVVCAGTGSIETVFTIGEQSTHRSIACESSGSGAGLTLTVAAPSTLTRVEITPEDATRAAVAYTIIRSA